MSFQNFTIKKLKQILTLYLSRMDTHYVSKSYPIIDSIIIEDQTGDVFGLLYNWTGPRFV